MDRSVKDKTVIVTGGAGGLGLSIADNFLKHEAKVVLILDVNEKEGNAKATELNAKYGEGKAVFIKCDVTKDLEKVYSEIIDAYKVVNVLVNNAGWVRENSIRATMELNVIALVEWAMKFFEHMRTDKGGKGGVIVNMCSILGYQAGRYSPFYTTSKHAVLGFTKSLGHADTFKDTGVRVVAVCPGFTRTNLLKDAPPLPGLKKVDDFEKFAKTIIWQDAEAVGVASVEIFERADSGTAWSIVGGNPIEQVVY